MSLTTLNAISPVDGRYHSKTASLHPYFSEYALIRYRVIVELRWFQQLAENPGIEEVPALGGAANAFLANDAEARDELETEIIPDDELTADIGNVLDTFDIPGLDSPEAKENFILRNKDWGYRISEKDKKRSKDLQKIHLWRTKELGGNDL